MSSILIIEDRPEARDWLIEVAQAAFPGTHRITHAPTLRQAFQAIDEDTFDIALIDLGLPDGSGLDALRRLRNRNAETLCVVTTVMADDAHIVAALSAGASGYLLKEKSTKVVVRQLAQLADGIPALSPSIARRIMDHFRRTGPVCEQESDLTPREREVLSSIARGFRNAEVGDQLGIAEGTVAQHIKAIYRKLGISSRAEAATHAARMGLSS